MKKINFDIEVANDHYIGSAPVFSSFTLARRQLSEKYKGLNVKYKLISTGKYKIYIIESKNQEYGYFAVKN